MSCVRTFPGSQQAQEQQLDSFDLNGTQPWLASWVNTCANPPVSSQNGCCERVWFSAWCALALEWSSMPRAAIATIEAQLDTPHTHTHFDGTWLTSIRQLVTCLCVCALRPYLLVCRVCCHVCDGPSVTSGLLWCSGWERPLPGGPRGEGDEVWLWWSEVYSRLCVCTVTVGMCTCVNERAWLVGFTGCCRSDSWLLHLLGVIKTLHPSEEMGNLWNPT